MVHDLQSNSTYLLRTLDLTDLYWVGKHCWGYVSKWRLSKLRHLKQLRKLG